MKLCPICKSQYPDDANFCPEERCATPDGPSRLMPIVAAEPPRFESLALLGGGSTGQVWRARDNQNGGEVAYKVVVQQALPNPVLFERAQRELKQLARATSARIVRPLDQGKTPEGLLWIAMPLVSGVPLDQLVRQAGALPLERVKRLMSAVGEALIEAQKLGVVHRDLAPKNVLVTAGDDVALTNFATARPVTDKVFGVPEFLAPEQAEGRPIDQRSNTYNLGAIMYFMLTGQPPFSGPDAATVLDKVLRSDAAPPSRCRPDPLLTAEIDRVVMKALEKSSSRRPLTIRQFLTEVEGLGSRVVVNQQQPEMGFAKTMMFSGGQAELQKMVQDARAAAEAKATAAAASVQSQVAAPLMESPSAAVQSVPTGPTPVQPPPAAAIAASMASEPRQMTPQPQVVAPAPRQVTPQPVVMAPAPSPRVETTGAAAHDAAAAVGMPAQGGKKPGAFRETLWFKKGEVEHLVAEAKAKAAAKGRDGEAELPPEDARPLEDRYVDDGSVTTEDRKKFSLRTGGTATALPTVGASVPGERMSADDMLNEIEGGKKVKIIVGAVAVVLALAVVAVLLLRGGSKPAEKIAAPEPPKTVVIPPAPPAPPPVAAPAAPAPTAAPAAAQPSVEAAAKPAPKARKKAKGKHK